MRLLRAVSIAWSLAWACGEPGLEPGAALATGGSPGRGRAAVERYGCGGCHTISAVRGARGLIGPPLDGVGERMYVAGVLLNTPENLQRWIREPQAVDSLTAMPDLGVTREEAADIASFLYTLR